MNLLIISTIGSFQGALAASLGRLVQTPLARVVAVTIQKYGGSMTSLQNHHHANNQHTKTTQLQKHKGTRPLPGQGSRKTILGVIAAKGF
jgi:hypothetical protein